MVPWWPSPGVTTHSGGDVGLCGQSCPERLRAWSYRLQGPDGKPEAPAAGPTPTLGARVEGGWEAPPGGLEPANPGVDRTGRRSRRGRPSLIIPMPPLCTNTPRPAYSPLHAFWGSPASFLRLTRPLQLTAVMKLQRTNLSYFNAGETPRRIC